MGSKGPSPALPTAAAAAVLVLLLLMLATPTPIAAELEPPRMPRQHGMMTGSVGDATGAYFVILKDAPAATYRGGVSGYEATQVQSARMGSDSTTSQKLQVSSAAVVANAAFLEEQATSVAAAASMATEDVLYRYKYILAGFSARVTSGEQLAALRRDPRVAAVERVQFVRPLTFGTPGFLGLEGNNNRTGGSGSSGGAWDQLGGVGRAGEDVTICVLDSGIEPEHPSFSDRRNSSSSTGPFTYSPPSKEHYRGACDIGEEFPAGTCK
jgi:subtilisin family serine protease